LEDTLRSFTLALILCLSTVPLSAQSIASGVVRGVVEDSTGRPLGNVRVAVTDPQSGVTRADVTPRGGTYAFAFLPPAEYTLLAERIGFLPVEVRGVKVSAGSDAELRITLRSVEPPVMEREVVAFGSRLDGSAAGPAWVLGPLELRRLADGDRSLGTAARFSTLADEALVIEGLPARHAQLSVDGIGFRFPSHPGLDRVQGSLPAFPLAAFTSLSVDPRGPDVEWSGFQSGRVSAAGRRGANRLEASVYSDWAPISLASSRHFDPKAVSGNSFRGGLVVAGPVIRDTAHFVLGVDAQRLELPFAPAWGARAADSALLAAGDSLGVDLRAYAAPRVTTVRVASGFGRFEWQANARNRLSVLAFGSRLESDGPVLGETHVPGLGARRESWDLGIGGSLTNVLSGAVALELRAGFEIGRQDWLDAGVPGTWIVDGPESWGSDPALPGRFRRTGARATETLHLTTGPHQIKLGGGGGFVSHEDVFAWGRSGQFVFGGPALLQTLDGGFTQTVGREPIAKFRAYELGWFMQDRWRLAPGAELLLGLRVDWERVDRTALARNAELLAISGIVTDSIDPTVVKMSPRVGLSWDVGNTHRWVVRADGGVYHGAVAADALAEAVAEAGGRQLRTGVGPLGRWPAAPDSIVAAPVGAVVSILPTGFSPPRSAKAALGVSGALGRGLIVHLAGSYRHTEFLVRRRDLNRVPGQAGRDQYGRPIYGLLDQRGAAVLATPGSGRRLDGFAVVNALNQDGVSDYLGVTARLERRVGRVLTLSAGYTYSQTRDNVPGIAHGPDMQLSPFPDSLNGAEWEDGVSDFDVPHRLVLGAELAFGAARLAGFYGLQSGRPFTPGFRDGVDANADGSWRNDPAFVDDQVAGIPDLLAAWDCLRTQVGGFAERNSCRGPAKRTLDLRLVVGPFRLGYPVEIVMDAMNLLDAELADVDRALYLVDQSQSLTRDAATGLVTVPLVVNPDFGTPIRRYGSGRYLRFGVRVNYE